MKLGRSSVFPNHVKRSAMFKLTWWSFLSILLVVGCEKKYRETGAGDPAPPDPSRITNGMALNDVMSFMGASTDHTLSQMTRSNVSVKSITHEWRINDSTVRVVFVDGRAASKTMNNGKVW
jgi:hypothetical protein